MADESNNGNNRKVITDADILALTCRKCRAKQGDLCKNKEGRLLPQFHRERIFDVYIAKTAGLSATDKALICYYAFVMLADSASAHSETMMGKQCSSYEIQVFFAREALKELQKDGLVN